MAEIQPFQGVLFNTQRVKPADVLTQPYDKITPAMRERYLGLSPYNLVRIELGQEQPDDTETNNKYTRAGDLYRAWLRDGLLRRSAKPAMYYLEQTFVAPNGSQAGIAAHAGQSSSPTLTRKALIARVRLHRWDEGQILPHEHTLSKPKADRIALLRACGSQQGQIFMLYPTPNQPWTPGHLGTPALSCVDDCGVTNTLWEITDPSAIRAIQNALRDQRFYIADGHHRYETALALREECRAAAATSDPDAAHEFVMATLVETGDPGLVILPTHRTVANLTGFDPSRFRKALARAFVTEPQPSLERTLQAMKAGRASALKGRKETGETHILLGMYDGNQFWVLGPKNIESIRPQFANKPPLWHTLDVAILHVSILEAMLGIDEVRLRDEANVSYWRDPETAVEQVRRGAAQIAFFLSPPRIEDVQSIADERSRMPQKSTDFYPKLLSGLVMYEVSPVPIGVR